MKLFLALGATLFLTAACTQTAANPEITGPFFMEHDDHSKICYVRGTDVICDYHEHNGDGAAQSARVPAKPHDQYHTHSHE